MCNNKSFLNGKSKELAYLLRHDTTYNFPNDGYRDVKDLVKNHDFTYLILEQIVRTDKKGRYEFNDDGSKIRARQGHSVNVDVGLTKTKPPMVLYHGTSTKSIDSIMQTGLEKRSRLYVHLSKDIETATNVGLRHGELVMLEIDSESMYNDGFNFYISNNGVWLVDNVPPKYLKILN
jgi:putative RNA 2'-phosphotransferase